ncbi:YsnF/AvaK domain-containing protein [Pontibacter silvestris]|uniref:YsnF/AvaK domain-containing protein n=1 Tax=Pontibacter silvestris TaxID=2305183 RepID=A0ABW4WTB6_9BACT|nr:YsnF/AvaK domain-containing protein [Pontibacter silvestris]MCC9138013.1 YsnF/AvaK domain-containing protein [Pontibacter silvestris]
MTQTVVGIFNKGIDAQTAAQKLESINLRPQNIDVLSQSVDTQSGGTTTTGNPERVHNFFNNLFDDKDEAKRYSEAARRGWVVTVHAQSKDEAQRAAETLDNCGAIDVNDLNSRPQGTATPPTGTATSGTTAGQSIPVIEEQMEVGKREVETGGVRLRSRIVERPVQESMRLREEHVHVERNPVNRPATDRDFANFKEGETTITEHAEIPMVNKEARVVEEVRIGKETEQHDETIKSTVRKTDIDVDKVDAQKDPRRTDNRNI